MSTPSTQECGAWNKVETYGERLREECLRPLLEACEINGFVPQSLQQEVLARLHPYFSVDARERAPTVIVTEEMAAVFHDLVALIMRHIDLAVVDSLETQLVSVEVKYALMSYKACELPPLLAVTGYDDRQDLIELSYYFRSGKISGEEFLWDGRVVRPRYEKIRGCRFFRRTLYFERIVWIPVVKDGELAILLNGIPVAPTIRRGSVGLSGAPVLSSGRDVVQEARRCFPNCKGRVVAAISLRQVLKSRILCWLANLRLVRRFYRDAWVFVDRPRDADDNAEHFYRWVRERRPEINAWFVLDRSAPDWRRLRAEGFRLVGGGVRRKLLLLNSKYVISSHADFIWGGLDPGIYGDRMCWRYVFLQHGVTCNDVSHWLGRQPFDRFITASPREHESIVGVGSPYRFSEKEVRRTGLPRHDKLLEISRSVPNGEVDRILVMPTWRGKFSDLKPGELRKDGVNGAGFHSSEYARRWREFLGSRELEQLARRFRKRVVFMPHPDMVPFIECFELPEHVNVALKSEVRVQELFCRSTLMVTDYSSVAFEMAYLRRSVIYYQFDREQFYGGDHNWREGYFSYERDGFGPVVFTLRALLSAVEGVLQRPEQAEAEYRGRMERALPVRDGGACQRVYESIEELEGPPPTP